MELDTHLPRSYVKAIEGIESEEEKAASEIDKRLSEAEAIFAAGAYEAALVSAFVSLERAIRSKAKDDRQPLTVLVRHLVDEGLISKDIQKRLLVVADLRNRAAHTGDGITKDQARQALNDLKEIISKLRLE
jgi:uncharacterized protein YutE (UPF0331/DUF86 family)